MKTIVVGAGKVGSALAHQLTLEGHSVTVVDHNPAIIERIVNIYDVMGICGNGASYDVQKEAGVAEADLLIATTSSDEINILTCLVAKKLGVNHTIARVRNPEYETQLRFMREELGLTMSINPEKESAREIARILRFPNAVKLESFSKGRIELIEYRIPAASPLDGMQLSDLYRTFHVKILICAVSRDDRTQIPSGDFVLRQNDTIHLTASPHDLEQFFRNLGIFKGRTSSAMIIGASKIGYYLASELLQMGISVRLIDQDEQRCLHVSELLPRALVITGDGTDPELLAEEGLMDTDAFVAVTGMDEANILMCMSASRQAGCKAVAKVNRQSLRDLVSAGSMIDSVVATGLLTADLILQYIRAMQNATGTGIKTLHRLVGGRVAALEFSVPAGMPFVRVPLRELKLRSGILLAGIVRRNGQIVIPSGEDCLLPDDDVIVVTTNSNLRDLRDIFDAKAGVRG